MTYRASLRATRMTAVRDDIDSGAGPGTLEILSAGDVVLVTGALNDPCGVVSGDNLTFSGMPKVFSIGTSGTAAKARIKESGGAIVKDNLTVGVGGSFHVNVDSTNCVAGQNVTVNSMVFSHPTT